MGEIARVSNVYINSTWRVNGLASRCFTRNMVNLARNLAVYRLDPWGLARGTGARRGRRGTGRGRCA